MEYPKIQTPFNRDPVTHKVNIGDWRRPEFTLIKDWLWSEKVDGTNIRIECDIASRTFKVRGRTNNAVIHPDLHNRVKSYIDMNAIAAHYRGWDKVTLFGEGFGAGIQKVGSAYKSSKDFILFDVLLGERAWRDPEDVMRDAEALWLLTVPTLFVGSIYSMVRLVSGGFQSVIPGATCNAEGLVGRPRHTLLNRWGERIIVKLKHSDFDRQLTLTTPGEPGPQPFVRSAYHPSDGLVRPSDEPLPFKGEPVGSVGTGNSAGLAMAGAVVGAA